MGSLDFAGDAVFGLSSGFGALAAALMAGERYSHSEPVKPNNVSLAMIGGTLPWFGFNAGSQGASDGNAATTATSTHLTSSAGFLTSSWPRSRSLTLAELLVGLSSVWFASPLLAATCARDLWCGWNGDELCSVDTMDFVRHSRLC
jgi:ammonia channel protein AmtB